MISKPTRINRLSANYRNNPVPVISSAFICKTSNMYFKKLVLFVSSGIPYSKSNLAEAALCFHFIFCVWNPC